MTLIPETNIEDGPCVVWIGSTIHGLDPVYGTFMCIADAKKWAHEQGLKDNRDWLILMLKPPTGWA